MGRLSSYAGDVADISVSEGLLDHIVVHLSQDNKHHKKAAAFVLRSVAKHNEILAQAVIDSGAVTLLKEAMREFDPSLKEAVVWCLSAIVKHSEDLAQKIVDQDMLVGLVDAYKEPDVTLKRVVASTLGEIAKHTETLATTIIHSGIIPFLCKDIDHQDSGLKRQVTTCLSQISKHSVETCEAVVAADGVTKSILALKDFNEQVRKSACALLREICRQSENLAKLVVTSGAVVGFVDYLNDVSGVNRIPAIMALGYIAATSETLALSVIVGNSISILREGLINEPDDNVKGSIAWTLGNIGKHSPEHARVLAEVDILRRLLAVYLHSESSEDVRNKAKTALKYIILQTTVIPMLEPLLNDAPPKILKTVVLQFAKVLTNDIPARKLFIQSGSLQQLQRIPADPESKLGKYISQVNSLYPVEVINFYSPLYQDLLLKKLDDMTS